MIQVSDLYVFIKSKLDEIKEEYWTEVDIFLAINFAVEEVFNHIIDISEEMFLQEGTVAITAATRESNLPTRARYVSSFCDSDNIVDYRPKWQSSGLYLDIRKDYFIGGTSGDKFVLKDLPTANDTIDIWYKAAPDMVQDIGDTINLPDVVWPSIVEIAVLQAQTKDENVQPIQAELIARSAKRARGQLANMSGLIRQIKVL